MNLKRILAGVLACCVIGGIMPSVAGTADNKVITANAVDDEDYTEGNYELLTYRNYGSYIEISGCYKYATKIVIPDKIEGVPVTSIGDSTFKDCTELTSITIPDSVTSIGDSAFENCSGLTEITIPDNVTNISDRAFYNCSRLTEITIPDSVTSIGNYVFSGSGLTAITIPDSVVNYFTFSCESLTAINVSDNNNNYASIDGVLFNKDKTELLFYPKGKSGTYIVPDGVTSISDSAFSSCSRLSSITIPDSVTNIGKWAFGNCSRLKKITILNPDCEIYDAETTISIGLPDDYHYTFGCFICGYENSTAQAYAEKYERKFSLPDEALAVGDVNSDGYLDARDSSIILKEYARVQTGKPFSLSEKEGWAADVNNDYKIDSADASYVLSAYVAYGAGIYSEHQDFFDISPNMNAPADGGFTSEEIENSLIKPVLSVSNENISLNEAKKNPVRTVSVDLSELSNINRLWNSGGITIKYDSRLKPVLRDDGSLDARFGKALGYMYMRCVLNEETSCIFIAATDYDNRGLVGNVVEIPFELPDDMDYGDQYNIEIVHSGCEVFTNLDDDETGKLMQAYLFTKGLDSGYIKIDDSVQTNTSTTTTSTTSTSTTTTVSETSKPTTSTTTATEIEKPVTTPVKPEQEVQFGDVNGDDTIDSSDATNVLVDYSLTSTGKESQLTAAQKAAADVDKDGKIDSSDASFILQYYAYSSTGGTEKDMSKWMANN